jgi:hypothetical protein
LGWFLGFFAWYNLPFIIPLFLVVVYVVLHLSGLSWGNGGGTEIGDIAVDVDDESAEEIYSHRFVAGILKLLNIRNVPLTMLLVLFIISWSIEGIAFNYALKRGLDGYPSPVFLVSAAISALISLGVVKLFAIGINVLTPSSQEASSSYTNLVGKTAKVIMPPGKTVGRARVMDGQGNMVSVYFRVKNGKALQRGDEILLLEYLPEEKVFDAERFDIEE